MSPILALLVVAVVLVLAWPWIRRRRGTVLSPAAKRASVSGPSPAPAIDDDVVATALAEIEFDHETGKLTDSDYAALRARYEGEMQRAVAAPARPLESPPAQPAPAPPNEVVDIDARAEAMIARAKETLRVCLVCGPRPEPDTRYCSSCARFLDPCPHCGREVAEIGARFCKWCGTRLDAPATP